jgi:hypothetical protein
LAAKNLRSIDIVGDGNCFYRALAFGLHGGESHHIRLRQITARHFDAQFQVIFGSNNLTATDKDAIHRRSLVLATDREEVGEEAIKTAADWMQSSIEVYTSSAKEPPLTYLPAPRCSCYQPLNQPLRIAFYEPGHYRAVVKMRGKSWISDVSLTPSALTDDVSAEINPLPAGNLPQLHHTLGAFSQSVNCHTLTERCAQQQQQD